MQFEKDFNHKERKEHRDKNLWRFFFAIYAFFAVNSFLVAACHAGIFAHLRGNSIQVPPHEPFTRQTEPFPIKVNQGIFFYGHIQPKPATHHSVPVFHFQAGSADQPKTASKRSARTGRCRAPKKDWKRALHPPLTHLNFPLKTNYLIE
jgi:hypothetical protein